ncbi:NAD(P)-dependent oxidoreductase [Sorangium sp. So ce233]|uniref:NAD(P)-dependent oxidoreductase n=1 Tax=Sorangium sp. So ce233 TaxID=3133290 RepID=UPI003F6025EF
MSDVSVIGLGSMGIALARALLRKGFRVTVWNRTSAKAEPLVAEGAALAPSALAAVQASAVVIVCVTDYQATYRVLEAKEVTSALAGKVLVQLSTGSPDEARGAEAWAKQRGVDYLDGAILATPRQVATPECTILAAGSETAFGMSKALLESMAGTVTYLGQRVGVASGLDLAFGSYLFAALMGFYHGARICEVEGLPVADFGAMAASIAPAIGQMVKHDSDTIQAGSYENPEATMELCAHASELLLRQARESRLNAELPSFLLGLFRKGVASGYGNESTAALIKVLRESV